MTVASEQWVMVGVMRTVTVRRGEVRSGFEDRGAMWMSGRETTASEPRDRGCSGSEMVEIRSGWGGRG